MNIQDRIKQLEKELAELKAEVAKKGKNRWRADLRENYHFITASGDIQKTPHCDDFIDKDRYAIGNYFKTQEEAKHIAEMIKIKQQLKDIALRLNKGKDIDWVNGLQDKYYITYSSLENEISQGSAYHYQHLGQVYCLDSNFVLEAEKEIGKDKLIELIKSGI